METFIAFTQKNILPLMPLVFVLVMLSQVVLGLISALFRRSKVKVYPSGQIEIGLSKFGSTIALFGTLQSLVKDSFVTQIELLLKDTTGQTCRTFAWRAFKPYTFSLVPNKQEMILELVSAFLISTKAPFKYNIVFVDDELSKSYAEEIAKIYRLWKDDESKDVASFLQTDAVQAMLTKFEQLFYWKAGHHYSLDMMIHAQNKTYTASFQLTVTEQQVDVLKKNFIEIVKSICGEKVQFPSIHCKYDGLLNNSRHTHGFFYKFRGISLPRYRVGKRSLMLLMRSIRMVGKVQ